MPTNRRSPEVRWTRVFRGPLWQVIALRARLDAEGIESFVPEPDRTLAPLISTAPIDVDLEVPEGAVARAAAVLAQAAEAPAQDGAAATAAGAPDEFERDAVPSTTRTMGSLGRSIAVTLSLIAGVGLCLWSAVLLIGEASFRSDALPATARVVELESHFRSLPPANPLEPRRRQFAVELTPLLSFVSADGQIVQGTLEPATWEGLSIGATLAVIYDPAHPSRVRLQSFPRAYAYGVLVGLALTLPWLVARWRAARGTRS